jgi:hypothetical protein
MAIVFKGGGKFVSPNNNPPKPSPTTTQAKSIADVRKQTLSGETSAPRPVVPNNKNRQALRNLRQSKPGYVEEDTPSNLIKPKYVEDKSVLYKNSSYLQELLGEEE